jgi:hypothetical protein
MMMMIQDFYKSYMLRPNAVKSNVYNYNKMYHTVVPQPRLV